MASHFFSWTASIYLKNILIRKELEDLKTENWEFFIIIFQIDRNNIYTQFCFSELLILREKKVSRILPLEYTKKIILFIFRQQQQQYAAAWNAWQAQQQRL